MATYSTDLTTMTTAESGTWTEFNSPYNGGGTPGLSGENFIQGTDCYAQNSGKAVGLEISIVYNHGSNISGTLATDDVIFAWFFYAVGTNLETYANSGWRFGIGASTAAWSWYRVGGSDYGRNPYGGWTNFAIDPTATATGTIGGGNGGAYQYFGNVPYTINEITKGDPTAVDAIRYGRGILSITGTGSTFSELASYNDYNAGGTPPGTSSTSVDSGYHRLGLFQDNGGVYVWKGLLSFGVTATSVTFSDSNETIIIDDCPHTYAAFNKIEVHNASSSVTLNNITFISTASTTIAKGRFEMIADATLNLSGCSFNGLDTFIFDSNSTVDGCTFNGCGLITPRSADLSNSIFNKSTSSSTILWNEATDTSGLLDGCSFISDGSNHAIEITSFPGTNQITLNDAIFTGYAAANGSTGNEAIYVNIGTGTFTIYTSNCSGNIYYRTAGATVTIIADPVTVQVTTATGIGIPVGGTRVHLEASDGTGPFPYNETVTITNSGTTATVSHTGHGMATSDKVVIRGASHQLNNGVHSITVTGVDSYTYTMTSAPGSNPTGTIKSTFVALNDLVNATTGIASTSRVYSSAQPIKGWARKNTRTLITAGSFVTGYWYTIVSIGTTDFTSIGASANTVGVIFRATGAGTGTGTAANTAYKTAQINGSVSSTAGFTGTGVMILDE